MNKIVAAYDYKDADGMLLYQNVRFEPKDFRQRKPDGNGGWTWSLDGVRHVLYRFPELLASSKQDWVLFVEGEKDTETLRSLGFEATTSGNASSWRTEFAQYFKGRLVCILPDKDTAGAKYAKTIIDSLQGIATEVRLGEVPGEHKDITDYVESRDSADDQALQHDVLEMIEAAKPIKAKDSNEILVVNASTWLESEPPEPDQVFADTFDRGDKIAIIGSSKLRKSFFLLQLVLSLASGRTFLAWAAPKPRRVFHIQFEIQLSHFHRRVCRMAKALGITPADLGDRLQVLNARGIGITGTTGIEKIIEIVKPFKTDIICFDPLYKVASGVENAAEDFKIILNAFDRLAEETRAAILFVHHDAKGFSGDRDIRDRGAGSNVLGRDYDACITLTPHVSEPDAAVVETLLRNYRPQEPFTALWVEDDATRGYRFEMRPEIAPTKRTSANGRTQESPSLESYLPAALEILKNGPMAIGTFKDRLRSKAGLTYARSDAFKTWALTGQKPPLDVLTTNRSRGHNEKLIGTSEQIRKVKDES